MSFRLILQPLMAALMGLSAGLKDAREGRPGYFWAILWHPSRKELFLNGWRVIARVFFLAVIIDAVYQWIVQRWVYPGELLIVAIVLAVLPYLLIRGPVNRIARRWRRGAGRAP